MTIKVLSAIRKQLNYQANGWRSKEVPDVSSVPRILYCVSDHCPPADGLLGNDGSTIEAAPVGSEAVYGGYMSVFGINFGTNQNGIRVRNHTDESDPGTDIVTLGGRIIDLGPCNGRPDVQVVHFQVGTSVTGFFSVETVNGTSNKLAWTAQPGRILYVSNNDANGYPLGNDSTALINDSAHPWRYVQQPLNAGADIFNDVVQPGDQVVLLPTSEGTEWNDTGYANHFFRVRLNGFVSGTEPTGDPGDGYVQLLGYPSTRKRAHIIATAGFRGCIGGHSDEGDVHVGGIRFVIGNLTATCPGGAAVKFGGPANLAVGADYWRVVNNIFGDWDAEWRSITADGSGSSKQGGISGNGRHLYVVGNQVRNIGGGQLNHGVYFDDDSQYGKLAYNWIHKVYGGNLVQFNANAGVTDILEWDVHSNLLGNGFRHGFNIAALCQKMRFWNNIVYNTSGAGVRWADTPSGDGSWFRYNTLANCGLAGINVPYNGACIMLDSNVPVGREIDISDNLLVGSNQSTAYIWTAGETYDGLTVDGNHYHGAGDPPAIDLNAGSGDPLFTNTTSFITQRTAIALDDVPRALAAPIRAGGRTVDLTLLLGSPCDGAGGTAVPPDDDFHIFKDRPSPPSIGAMEVLFTEG
jgi:hypothetical protein